MESKTAGTTILFSQEQKDELDERKEKSESWKFKSVFGRGIFTTCTNESKKRAFIIVLFFLTANFNAYSQNEEDPALFYQGKANHLVFSWNEVFTNVYVNCENNIKLFSPTYCNDFNPRFLCEGGITIWNPKTFNLTLIPNQAKVLLKIVQKDSLLAEFNIVARRPPLPKYRVLFPYCINPDSIPCYFESLKIMPHSEDEFFNSTHPNDARYKVSEIQLKLKKDSILVLEKRFQTSNDIFSLDKFLKSAEQFNRIEVVILKTKRLNSMNTIFEVFEESLKDKDTNFAYFRREYNVSNCIIQHIKY